MASQMSSWQSMQRLPNSSQSSHPSNGYQGQGMSDFGPGYSQQQQQQQRNDRHQTWSGSQMMMQNGSQDGQQQSFAPPQRQQWPPTSTNSTTSSLSGQHTATNTTTQTPAMGGSGFVSNQQTPSMAQDGFQGSKSQSMQPFPSQVREQDFARRGSPSSQMSQPMPPPQQQQQFDQQGQQPHRRTQSMRPLSAFQPLDEPGMAHPGSPASQRPPSPTGSTARSIRTAAAPLTFKSPELRSALSLQEAQNRKIYMEGYLSKREHLGPDGRSLHVNDAKKRWQLCFVQLLGTVLSVWGVQQMEEAARQGTEVPPTYINVTDSFVDFVGTITESPQEVPGSRGKYENVFAVNTAGQNRILFGVEGQVGRRLVQAWVNAIRLATWEKVRLEEIYTGSLVRARLGAVSAQQATSGPGGAPGDVEMTIKSPLSKGGRMEGWVKARFMGSTEWKKCWLVLSDSGAEAGAAAANDKRSETGSIKSNNRMSFWSKLKAGDRSSILGSPSVPSFVDTGLTQVEPPPGCNGAPGLASFFETKKARKPFATLAYAAHAFAVYPSRPELVEGSSLFKIEGTFPLTNVISATNRKRQSGWVMIMPELDTAANKGANAEMMKWCIAFMDAFRLYGRPAQFQWDARNPLSPFFAYPIGPYKDRLFLDRELAEFLDIREERHLANRSNLHGIMAARMRGERTPILPPLPQPNSESTRQLNAAKGAVLTGQMQNAQPRPGQDQQDGSAEPNGREPEPANGNRLPPLDTSVSQDETMERGDFQGTQLSSIGERSREGSMFTGSVAPTPITPGGANAIEAANAANNNNNGRLEAPPQPEAAQDASASTGTAPSSTNGAGANAPAQFSHDDSTQATPPSPSMAASKTIVTPPTPREPQQMQAMQATAAAAAATAAAAAAPAPAPPQTNQTTLTRKDSDPLEAYDEGALYFINSMGDSLPTVHPKSPRRPQSTSSHGATNARSQNNVSNGVQSSGGIEAAVAAVAASGAVSASSRNASTDDEGPKANNAKSVSNPRGAGLAPPDPRMSMYNTTVDNFPQDALAASTYLDSQQSSPPAETKNQFGIAQQRQQQAQTAPQQPSTAMATPTPVRTGPTNTMGVPAQTSFPSTFGANKKAQERKLQAQNQQDAIAKPGRPGGAKGKKMGTGPKHAWAADDDEDEDEDEDEEENDAAKPTTQYSGMPAAQGQFRGPAPQQNSPRLQGSTPSTTQSSYAPQQQQYGQQPANPYVNRNSSYPAVAGSSAYLGAAQANSARGSSPAGSHDSAPKPNTFVQLSREEQPGSITTVFQPHGLLQAGDQDKVERSAKQQEADARAMGGHLVSVEGRPPEPQAGLLGAISAHERDRKKDGGFGATLTERERERVAAERRQREEDAMRMQQQQRMMGATSGAPPGWGQPGMPPAFNPMMWQQMQMMSMMNPMMFGAGGPPGGSQMGHGGPGGLPPGTQAPNSPDMAAQMRAQQAAQQAYMQAMQQASGGGSGGGAGGGAPSSPHEMSSPQMPQMSMGMMPFNPYMSMYGAPMGFPAWGAPPGSDMGMMGAMSPQMTTSPASPMMGGMAAPSGGAGSGTSPHQAQRTARGSTSSPLRR